MSDSVTRRDALMLAAACMASISANGCAVDEDDSSVDGVSDDSSTESFATESTEEKQMKVHYLEIVTENVDAACEGYSAIHGVTFGDPDQSLGGARTAALADGGSVGVRAPMHEGEKAVTRAYFLVDDIEAAVAAAKEAGGEIAVPPMELPGHGKCAIYFQGGIEAGLFQK